MFLSASVMIMSVLEASSSIAERSHEGSVCGGYKEGSD